MKLESAPGLACAFFENSFSTRYTVVTVQNRKKRRELAIVQKVYSSQEKMRRTVAFFVGPDNSLFPGNCRRRSI